MQCAPTRRCRSSVLLLLGVPLLTAAHGGAATTAAPHLALRRSDPADQSRLVASPAGISLWFTARPQLAFSRIALTGPVGSAALDTIVADTGNALHARIPRALPAGDYRVSWQTASADGHPIRGEFMFSVLPSGDDTVAGTLVGRDSTARAADGHEGHAIPAGDHTDWRSARWMEFVALLTILGALGFRHGVLPPLAARGVPTADAGDRALRLGQGALFLYGLAAILRLYAQSAAVNGQSEALAPDPLFRLMTETSWGIGWTTGVVGAALVALGWLLSSRRMAIGTPLALTGALGLVAAPGLTGHATSSGWFITALSLDMLHVLSVGIWIGGLLLVLLAGVPAMRRLTDGNPDAAVSALVNSFHPLALFCAPIVVATGIGSSIMRLGGLGHLGTTRYGTILLLKVGLFLVVAGIALYNSVRARRGLGTADGTAHLRRTASVELLFAALVIAATAALVTTPAPSLMAPPQP